jgi:hypothetical protein
MSSTMRQSTITPPLPGSPARPEQLTALDDNTGSGLGHSATTALIALAIAVASGTLLWVLNAISTS